MILGVSDWLSPKLNVEAKYIRIGFVIGALFAGVSVLIYLIIWFFITFKIVKK